MNFSASLEEAKVRMAELLEKALSGETIEIRFNRRKAKLDAIKGDEQAPPAELPPRQQGLLKGKGWIADAFNEPLDNFNLFAFFRFISFSARGRSLPLSLSS